MTIPDEETLITAVKALRTKEPTLARAKILKQLKEENNWELSEKRLKACMDANNLNTAPVVAGPELLGTRDAAYDKIVKNAFQEFTRLERDFFLGLSLADCKALMEDPDIPEKYLNMVVACHQRHHVEILLTLKGLKPCTGIHHHIATHIFTRMVNEILKPLIKKYGLKFYGFDLRKITHATMIDIGKPKPEKFWQGGWVFADTTSPLLPEIQNILLPNAQMDVTRQDRDAYEDRMGKVLGYPVLRYPRDMSDFKTVRYMDETERQILAKLCEEDASEVEVTGLEYDDEAGLFHFGSCAKAMKSVGSELRIDLHGHPAIHELWNNIRSGQGMRSA